jgi:hypothetical protein
MATTSIPLDLKGYGEKRLLKLDPKNLRQLCKERHLPVSTKAHKSTCVASLLEWKQNKTAKATGTKTTKTTKTKTTKQTKQTKHTTTHPLRTISTTLAEPFASVGITRIDARKALNSSRGDMAKAGKLLLQQVLAATTNQFNTMTLENKQLKQANKAMQKDHIKLLKQFKALRSKTTLPRDEHGFTTTQQFRRFLIQNGFDVEGQDVHHIIASHHGGADHVDNYLYTAGQSFNRGHGANFDALHCHQAGVHQVRRAIKACKRAERLKHGVALRHKSKVTYWSEGPHNRKTAEALVAEGSEWFRAARRHQRGRK